MYGIVLCRSCERRRIVDLRTETSQCPYCGKNDKTKGMTVLFSDNDQNIVRNVLNNADSRKYPEPKKKGPDPDPLSTLVYEYEHTSGTAEKLMVLAAGLTRIKKEFTENDVDELFPGKGEQMLKQMILCDAVIEIRFGFFKAV
jgi:RNA polymerase subunit RPABC4/transcription elongation factor Spt4